MRVALLGAGPDLLAWGRAACRRGWTVRTASGRELQPGELDGASFEQAGADPSASDNVESRGEEWVESRGEERQRPGWAGPGSDEWEQLLGDRSCDCVLISADRKESWRAEALRKLAQAEIPLMIGFPPSEPMLALELDMIRQESHPGLLTHCPGQGHPLWDRLGQWLKDESASPIGRLELVSIDVPLADSNRPHSWSLLARHCLLLRELVGPIERVLSVAEPDGPKLAVPRQTTCTARSGLLVRWSVVPPATTQAARWNFMGDRGSACLTTPFDTAAWELTVEGSGNRKFQAADWDESEHVLTRLQAATETDTEDTSWTDACHALDLADAAVRSSRRGRSIDLFETGVTEESAFKGAMAIGGCGMLMLALSILVMGSIFEGLGTSTASRSRQVQIDPGGDDVGPGGQMARPTGARAARPLWIRWWPTYPLLLFLLGQLLRTMARRASPKPQDSPETAEPTGGT